MKNSIKILFPGLLLSLLLSILSQLLAQFLPTVGAALLAILLGLIAGNTFFQQPIFDAGTKFAEKRLLEIAIVLNGLTLDFQLMREIGLAGLLFVLLQMTLTIVAAYGIGRLFRFTKVFSLLMGAGNAVCGTAAIGTVSPILDAKSKEKGMSITAVNVMGTFLMMGLPLLAALLYDQAVVPTSALIGGVIQSVGQVVASAKIVGDDVLHLATVFKLLRVLMIAGVALIFSRLNLKEEEPLFHSSTKGTARSVSFTIPWFIIGFLLFFGIRSLDILPESFISFSSNVRSQFEIMALAAIGMRIRVAEIAKEGPKVLLYGLTLSVVQVVLAIFLISIFF